LASNRFRRMNKVSSHHLDDNRSHITRPHRLIRKVLLQSTWFRPKSSVAVQSLKHRGGTLVSIVSNKHDSSNADHAWHPKSYSQLNRKTHWPSPNSLSSPGSGAFDPNSLVDRVETVAPTCLCCVLIPSSPTRKSFCQVFEGKRLCCTEWTTWKALSRIGGLTSCLFPSSGHTQNSACL
jgi:hypothetical protein